MLEKIKSWDKWSLYDDDGFCGISESAPEEVKKEYEEYLQDRIDNNVSRAKEIAEKCGIKFDENLKKLVVCYCKKYPKVLKKYDVFFPEKVGSYEELVEFFK